MHTPDALRSPERRQLVAAIDQQRLLLSLLPAVLPRPGTPVDQRRMFWPSAILSPKRTLFLLYGVEALAGFALHALSAVLVLFLSEHGAYSQSRAIRFVSTVNALCYLGPLLGGWLADRYLGFRWTVLVGAMSLCTGFCVMARVPSALLPAAGLIVIGSALFRSNIVALAGRLSHVGNLEREAAYRGIYIAFNLGAVIAPPVAAALRIGYGWAAPFAACALAMAGVVALMASGHASLSSADQRDCEPQRNHPSERNSAVDVDGISKQRTIILMLLIAALWATCTGQTDGSLLLWARDHVHRTLLGYEVPPSAFASVPPLFALLLLPLVGALKRWNFARSPSSRIAIGMSCTALAMAMMALASLLANGAPSSAAWLLGCFMFLMLGELLVIPLSQSVLSQLAPRRRQGLVIAASYGAIAVGHGLAGVVGVLWLLWPKPAFFGLLACVAACGVLLLRKERQSPS